MRIDRGGKREVFACARYFVTFDGSGAAVLTLVGMPSETPGDPGPMAPRPFHVTGGECAFVMNDKGVTCDVIRALRVPVAKGA